MENKENKLDSLTKQIISQSGWENAPDNFTNLVMQQISLCDQPVNAKPAFYTRIWLFMAEYKLVFLSLFIVALFFIPYSEIFSYQSNFYTNILVWFRPLAKYFSTNIAKLTLLSLVLLFNIDFLFKKFHFKQH